MTTLIHVATNGNDAWSGTLASPSASGTDGPFATLARAVEATRTMKEPAKRILIRGGSYYDVSVSLDERDSGLAIEAAPGETPLLYGGHPITGWKQDGPFWTADLPEVASGSWDFRMLQVNGRMCPRARLPHDGVFTHESVFPVRWMTSTGGGWERKPTFEELTTLKYREGDLGDWLEAANAEVTVYHAWDDSMVGVAAIDTEKRTLTFSSPCGHPPGGFGAWLAHANTYVVWNTREGMSTPGQWYLDRSAGKVVYWPLPGETLAEIEAIAPTTKRIFSIHGREDALIQGLRIAGLTLAVTNTPLIEAGFGAENLDGAITGMAPMVDCQLTGMTIRNVAGNGIKIRDRVHTRSEIGASRQHASANQAIRIERCTTDCTGAGGIYLTARDSAITDNLVTHVGLMYPAAIGIRFTGDRVEVSHNEISHTSYSAIAGHYGQGARVEYNLLSAMMQVLRDGAAIYVFYVENLMMRGNVTYGAGADAGSAAHAYYFDEFSVDCDMVDNLSINVGWPIHNHMAQNDRIRGNVCIVDGDAKITFPRSSGFTMERNLIYATGKVTLSGINAVTQAANNLIFSGSGEVIGVDQVIYTPGGPINALINPAARVGVEYPIESGESFVLADPLFTDIAAGDTSFRAESPAQRLGIRALNPSQAGRRT